MLYTLLLAYSSYELFIVRNRVANEYNNMKGVVQWVTFIPRSGDYMAGIKLSNGFYGEVNLGYRPYYVNDVFTNKVDFLGSAYYIVPNEEAMLFWLIVFLLCMSVPISFIITLFSKANNLEK